MTTSFMARHRTICAVLEELRTMQGLLIDDKERFDQLITEAKTYAQSMSNRLMEHKRREEGHTE